jgi:hypothetical protein
MTCNRFHVLIKAMSDTTVASWPSSECRAAFAQAPLVTPPVASAICALLGHFQGGPVGLGKHGAPPAADRYLRKQ